MLFNVAQGYCEIGTRNNMAYGILRNETVNCETEIGILRNGKLQNGNWYFAKRELVFCETVNWETGIGVGNVVLVLGQN